MDWYVSFTCCWEKLFKVIKITFLFLFLETTCIGYLFFQVSAYEDMCRIFVFQFSVYEVFYCGGKFSAKNFLFPCSIFIVSENCHWFCNVWFFATKTHPLVSTSHGTLLEYSGGISTTTRRDLRWGKNQVHKLKNFCLELFWCLSSNLFELYKRGKIQNVQRILQYIS